MTIDKSCMVVAIGCLAFVSAGVASADEPWVATYSLQLPDEIARQITDGGGALPTLDVTLHADGSFESAGVEGERTWTGKGSYTVKGATVTMTEKQRDGKAVTQDPMRFEADEDFALLSGVSSGMPLTLVRKD